MHCAGRLRRTSTPVGRPPRRGRCSQKASPRRSSRPATRRHRASRSKSKTERGVVTMARTQPQPFGVEGRQDRPSVGELLLRHTLLWLSLPLLLLAGFLAHQFWASSPALPLITAAIAVCTGGMAATTWIVSSRYATPGRVHITGTVAMAGLWLLAATVSSPLDSPVAQLLWLPGIFLVS